MLGFLTVVSAASSAFVATVPPSSAALPLPAFRALQRPSLPRAVASTPPTMMCAPAPDDALATTDKPSLSGPVPSFVPTLATGALAAAAAIFLHPASASAAGIADSSFVQASSLIFVSEIGDKTFFIAALLAARASKLLTFAGCAGALALMTAISVVIGQVFHAVPTSITRGLPIDDYIAIASFLYFGVKSLVDAFAVEDDGAGIADEREEAEETLESIDVTGGWPLVVEACTLTIAAEIGDRSQLATIALSAAANPFGVFLGGTAGHCVATGMAVLGGSFISKYLSERAIGIVGGVLFIFFALTTAVALL